jgi:hypothetical protein
MRKSSRVPRLCAVIGIAASLTAASPGFAADALGALLACRKIDAGAARLACFDRESAALAERGSPAKPHASLGSRETFGLAPLEVAARAEAAAHAPKPLDTMAAHITSIARAADGREIFVLDNSQVWVQLTADGNWLEARTGEQVNISRGWLDSYWLSLSGHRGFKVTRVR